MRGKTFFILALAVLLVAFSGCQAEFTFEPSASGAPLPLTGENASRLGAAALILEEQEGLDHFAIIPVSADTGERIADAQSIELGGEIAYGFSRDRSQMAFLSNHTDDCEKYCLRVMDLRRWEEIGQPIPVEKDFSTWFMLPAFDAASNRIPVILNRQTDTASDVILVDRSQGAVTARVSLSANVTQVAVTGQGDIAIYGIQTMRDGSGPVAYLALLSGADLRTLWEQTAPEIVFFEGKMDHTDPFSGRFYDPAAVFAPDGSRLFIAAADRPVLLTVDFAQQRISSIRIAPRTGWLERLFEVKAAHAKTMNGITRSGVLSPDGRYLFIVGQEYRAKQNARGEYETERIPLGLQVIDTQDGALVREVDTNASQVSITPDGKTLLLGGWQDDLSGGHDWVEIVDLSSLKSIQRLKGYARPSRLLDGSTAWLLVPASNGITTEVELYRPGDREPRSRVTHTRYVDWIVIQ